MQSPTSPSQTQLDQRPAKRPRSNVSSSPNNDATPTANTSAAQQPPQPPPSSVSRAPPLQHTGRPDAPRTDISSRPPLKGRSSSSSGASNSATGNRSSSTALAPRPIAAAPLAPKSTAPIPLASTSASSSAATSSSFARPVQPLQKRRYTRSRSGCTTCRLRKVKCDETQPRCRRCHDDGRACQGYFQGIEGSQDRRAIAAVESSDPPQHLEDWLDLLCASIGTDLESSGSNVALSDASSALGPSGLSGGTDIGDVQQPTPDMLGGMGADQGAGRGSQVVGPTSMLMPGQGSRPQPFNGVDLLSLQWMSDEWDPMLLAGSAAFPAQPAAPLAVPLGSDTDNKAAVTAPEPSTQLPTDGCASLSEESLQAKIRSLCKSKSQLEAVSFFFNTSATCFHLLTAETNVWRIFFAQLASESSLILDLVACLGLTHLSFCNSPQKRAAAHANFSRCKAEWDAMVGTLSTPSDIERATAEVQTQQHLLEILAGALLIGHIEQFGRGCATVSQAYMALALHVAKRNMRPDSQGAGVVASLDRGPSSAFRFYVRILVWWETMSRTMGPASGRSDLLDFFEVLWSWEEDGPDQDPIECLTQCVIGWPLDLLEAMARTVHLVDHPGLRDLQPRRATSLPTPRPSTMLSQQLEGSVPLELQHQIDAVETQIRLSRPLPLGQDDGVAAELRYLIFECLQSASLVFFSKTILGTTDGVWCEIDKVTRFLERKERSGTELLTEMQQKGKWFHRAADGALIWAYFQCALETFGQLDSAASVRNAATEQPVPLHTAGVNGDNKGPNVVLALGSGLSLPRDVYAEYSRTRSEKRERCRKSLLMWQRLDDLQCTFLCRHLLKAIWDRRDLYEQEQQQQSRLGVGAGSRGDDNMAAAPPAPAAAKTTVVVPYDQKSELAIICRERRWKQPLIF